MVDSPGRAILCERIVRRRLITPWLNQNVDYVAVLIDGSRKIVSSTIDPNENFVQVPAMAEPASRPLETSSIARTELSAPDSNRFITNNDSAFGEKILDISEAQAETMVNPDGVADDFWRETVAVIARAIVLHRSSVSFCCPSRQCPLA